MESYLDTARQVAKQAFPASENAYIKWRLNGATNVRCHATLYF